MKTYVVNMQKDTAKRAQIEAQLAEHPELDYQIWKAVEGRKLSEEEQKKCISPDFKQRYGNAATLPVVGCSLSHVAIYRDMVDNNIKYSLILEDDAVLSENLRLDSCVDLLSTEKPVAVLLTPDFWFIKDERIKNVDNIFNLYALRDGYMTSGYLINREGANLILRANHPVKYTADAWQIFIEKGLTLYGMVPHVISYPDGIGEIGRSILPVKGWRSYRSKLIRVYLKVIFLYKFIQGYRHSKKQW